MCYDRSLLMISRREDLNFHKRALETGKRSVISAFISNEIYFDVPDRKNRSE